LRFPPQPWAATANQDAFTIGRALLLRISSGFAHNMHRGCKHPIGDSADSVEFSNQSEERKKCWMSETNSDLEETGFAFTEEELERRYSADKLPLDSPHWPPANQPTRIHGGGNSFMRARRRRLAASGSD
jgi:hypothetical protein